MGVEGDTFEVITLGFRRAKVRGVLSFAPEINQGLQRRVGIRWSTGMNHSDIDEPCAESIRCSHVRARASRAAATDQTVLNEFGAKETNTEARALQEFKLEQNKKKKNLGRFQKYKGTRHEGNRTHERFGRL
jgi:hypothetical protein